MEISNIDDRVIERIVRKIEDGKCILILGPDLIFDCKASMNEKLKLYIDEHGDNQVRYYSDDEFFSFLNESDRILMYDYIADFFASLTPTLIYEKITEIPFQLIISTSPDTTLLKAFEKKGIEPIFDFFHKAESPKPIGKPSRNSPLLYNLFGCYKDENSLIITYEDLFEYLQSIFGKYDLQFRKELSNAHIILFLGFKFEKWYFRLLLRLLELHKGKLAHSPEVPLMDEVKAFYVEEFKINFLNGTNPTALIDRIHSEFANAGSLRTKAQPTSKFELFISYSVGSETDAIVEQLTKALTDSGITLLRDKRDLGFKASISEFMLQLGKGKAIIVIVSDAYLKSPYCMYELLEIYRNRNFNERIFPIVTSDATIFEPIPRLNYLKYWQDKKRELDDAIVQVGGDAIAVIGDDYKVYKRIFDNFGEVVNILKDINSLTPQTHRDTNFDSLLSALKNRFDNDK